ncbi:MAG: EVE domain-containing protein [Puniceicoccaceae bacterium]
MKKHWLMKSEPETFSIDDLAARPGGTEPWDGIRNYQARNFMRDEMKVGDAVLFYHSNCPEPGVAGLAEIASAPYPDPTAFDPESEYFDPGSDPAKPRWMLVDVRFVRKFPRTVTLREMRGTPALAGMKVLQRGNRLSITPVRKSEFDRIVRKAEK